MAQKSAQQLTGLIKSTIKDLKDDELPPDTSSLKSWLDWPAGKGGKYMVKLSSPPVLYKGDIVFKNPDVDYVAMVPSGGSVTGKYRLIEYDAASGKKYNREKTGPVEYVLRWKGAFNDANVVQSGDLSERGRIMQAAQAQWNASKGGSLPSVFLVGVRGFFNSSNKRNIYDDAIAIVGPGTFLLFRANVDPSSFKQNVASLNPGVHPFKPGLHGYERPGGPYPAFRSATPNQTLPVSREGRSGTFAGKYINIHRGGNNTTSSLGCQTIHPNDWNQFYAAVMATLTKNGVSGFDYILANNTK